MVLVAALLLLQSATDRPAFLQQRTLTKPSMDGLVSYTIQPHKAFPDNPRMVIRVPKGTTHRNGLLKGDAGGQVTFIVEADGQAAKGEVMATMQQWELARRDKKPVKGIFVADAWVGRQAPYRFTTDDSRSGHGYELFCDRPFLKASMLASWPKGDKKAEFEAKKIANYILWTATPAK